MKLDGVDGTDFASAVRARLEDSGADFSVVNSRYDEIADDYDSIYAQGHFIREDRIVAESLARIVRPTDRVLDLGCGTGKALDLLPAHSQYLGIDVSTRMLARARDKFPEGDFELGEAEDLRLADDSFDFVVSTFGSMSHARDLNQVVDEIARVLRPGGRFCVMLYGLSGRTLPGPAESQIVDFVPRALRHSEADAIPAWLYSQRDAMRIFERRFVSVRVEGLTLASRDARRDPIGRSLDSVDRVFSRLFPDRAQSLVITGKMEPVQS